MEKEKSCEETVAMMRAGSDQCGCLASLWELIRNLAASEARRYSHVAEFEDLMQESFLAMVKAAECYDPEAGTKFSTYAVLWIRQALRKYACDNSSCIRIPASERRLHRLYKTAADDYRKATGREPGRRELSHMLGLPFSKLEEIERTMGLVHVQSLDSPLGEEDGNTLGDMVPDAMDLAGSVEELEDRKILYTELWEAVSALDQEDADVIRKRYIKGCTRKQIGEGIGRTAAQVMAMESRALRTLGRKSRIRRLYLPEEIESFAYRHTGVSEFNRTWTSTTEKCALKIM